MVSFGCGLLFFLFKNATNVLLFLLFCRDFTLSLETLRNFFLKTKWAKNKEISFLTGLRIIGLDDVGVVNKITNLISGEMKINISAITIEANEGLFEGNIKLYVHDKEELDVLVGLLKSMSGIHSVDRFDAEAA